MATRFEKFLSDENIYDEAVAYWQRLIAGVATSCTNDIWVPWPLGKYVDGRSLRDGNPLVAMRCAERQDRTVMIALCEVQEMSGRPIAAWTGQLMGGEEYLRISLLHTENTEKYAVRLLRHFICNNPSLVEMDFFIAEWMDDAR